MDFGLPLPENCTADDPKPAQQAFAAGVDLLTMSAERVTDLDVRFV